MGRLALKLGVLTSSRADYGIYLPLLRALKHDKFFDLHLLVFGAHLSEKYGYTASQIEADGFQISHQFLTAPEKDTPNDIVNSMAKTMTIFAGLWEKESFDLLISLGDRYEMFSAVYSTLPFNIPVIHIHGGETTLGAIDNAFRHAISLVAKYHFVSCEEHGERIARLTGSSENIYNIGALSLDNLTSLDLYTIEEFFSNFGVNLNTPTILVTVHPETISPKENEHNVDELVISLNSLNKYQILITLPNADPYNISVRKKLLTFHDNNTQRVFCFENLGSKGYFTALKYCSFLLGNTSSGIIEAASFGKWVINLGNRQLGRKQSNNTLNVPFNSQTIIGSVNKVEENPVFIGENVYFRGNAAAKICSILKGTL